MAWVERRGNKWRVRYWKPDGRAGSVPGSFETEQAACEHADQLNATAPEPAEPPHTPTTPAPRPPAPAPPTLTPPETVTVAEWAEIWWQTLDVGDNTEAFYRSLLTRHILPRWGTTPLDQITPADVQVWLNRLRATYATATITGLRKLFAMIMTDAVDNQLLATNPVRPRRRGRGRIEPRRERPWADEHQVLTIAHRILRLAARNQCLLVITAAYTGMRWGELAALHRDNLDITNGRIHITPDAGALHEVNGRLTLGHPKTHASVRTVTLPPFLTQLLATELAASTRPFVFTTLHGKHLRRSGFQRRLWAPAAGGGRHRSETWTPVKQGLTFHGLRHSHKTWLIEDGVPEVAQARRLGHTMEDKNDDVYSHVAASIDARLLAGLETRWHRSIERYRHNRNDQGTPPITS
ncbi:tyrosine-type recombinase/integrase [Streptomyces lonegramiae]|uniref:Site-specific integrase n=1 Tax=Streptomyces lonegramiae TaxID=3075524 RepID=A0ABU2XQ95_9ACTN|nr:site-specific integrase [Streptomyces sp. DSM 41529]MDT0547736.1 site-specific integrase [Streptomyces sp. DSM 41529]